SGGENVYPGEVEELLAKHPKISDAAVVGVEDKDFGQRLKAYVVTSGGSDLSEDEVKQYVKEHLARYKVPRDVEFLDELPRNATGKVVKRELVKDDDEDASDHEYPALPSGDGRPHRHLRARAPAPEPRSGAPAGPRRLA